MSARRIIDEQYEIIREIKAGGFGTIYYGWDLTLDRPVAIKEVVKSLLGEKQYVDMFIDEAVNTARLNHPNIVQVYSLRKTPDDRVFIIMQFIEGVDLREVIDYYNDRNETMPKNMAMHIISEICKALEYAHNLKDRKSGQPLNIVHRDISPSNIMLTVEGSVKLIDFGIAKARNRIVQKTQTGFVKGKVAYMSPEQLEGKEATRQSDIFSLGSVFYEMCTGEELFSGDSDFTVMKKITSGQIDFAPLETVDLPEGCSDVIRQALKKDRSERYKSANEMYVDLYHLSRKYFPGEPTSDLSRLVHSMYVKEPVEAEEKATRQNSQQKIKTQILSTPPEPEPVGPKPGPPEERKTGEQKPKREPAAEPEEAKTVIYDSTSEEARTVIHDTSGDEARTSIYSSESADAKTVVREVPSFKRKKPAFDFQSSLAALKRADKRIWVYGGGAIIILILLLIIGTLIGGAGGSSGPSGEYAVWINSVPEGAVVFLNGEKSGKTPLQINQLDAGQYNLRIEMDKASPIDTQFVLKEGDQITFPNFVLKREARINSIPQGASIFVDNNLYPAVTPALVPIPLTDSVDIRLEHEKASGALRLAGFNVSSGDFKTDNEGLWDYSYNKENELPEITGRFRKNIKISSKPQGADIYLEDQDEPVGQTPDNVMIPFGQARIRLVKSGFEDKVRLVDIDENFQGSLFYELYREVAVTAVAASNPKGGDIGARITKIESEGRLSESADKTPINLLLTGVEHRIYLSKRDYIDTSFVIGVNQTELKAVMRKVGEEEDEGEPVEEPEEVMEKAMLIFVFKDDDSDEPLEGVNILAERKDDRKRIYLGTTNEFGQLAVQLEAGKYKLIADKDGYKGWDDGKSIKENNEYKIEEELKRE
ncbi:MAG TPA: PEGA domain-containing protein [candidate division Zixibacteria bacterium]|nr:PEGA domain-containing protein [candidate division Zixibacteria bacterium]